MTPRSARMTTANVMIPYTVGKKYGLIRRYQIIERALRIPSKLISTILSIAPSPREAIQPLQCRSFCCIMVPTDLYWKRTLEHAISHAPAPYWTRRYI
jgi:hypothetical protein